MAIKLKGLDHYAIAIGNLERSLTFYHDILGLGILPRPDFDFEGAWLDCGNGISIHLIVQEHVQIISSGSRSLHFAFGVEDIHAAKEILTAYDVQIIKDIKPRPDGILQMFVQDPDGYFVELTQG